MTATPLRSAIALVSENFLRFLTARSCSPNTIEAYAHDLLHFYRFLDEQRVGWEEFTPARSLAFLEYLRAGTGRNTVLRQ